MMTSSSKGPDQVKIVVESAYEVLETVVDEAHDFCMRCESPDDVLHKVMLLTSEAVTNAIKHGNQLAKDKVVRVEFYRHDQMLEVWVQDEGDGFVREEIPNPLAEEHLLDTGGRGIFLIERIADEVRYELGGRRVGMFFSLNQAS
jgi:serine/threonine-protein kinase RsbW